MIFSLHNHPIHTDDYTLELILSYILFHDTLYHPEQCQLNKVIGQFSQTFMMQNFDSPKGIKNVQCLLKKSYFVIIDIADILDN